MTFWTEVCAGEDNGACGEIESARGLCGQIDLWSLIMEVGKSNEQ